MEGEATQATTPAVDTPPEERPEIVPWAKDFQERRRKSLRSLRIGGILFGCVVVVFAAGGIFVPKNEPTTSLAPALALFLALCGLVVMVALPISIYHILTGAVRGVLLGRALRMFCPFCEGFISSHDNWRCGRCGSENNGKEDPFLFRCGKCRSAPDTYRCHRCHRLLYLTDKKVGQSEDPVGATKVGYEAAAPVAEKEAAPQPEDVQLTMMQMAERVVGQTKGKIEAFAAMQKAREETYRTYDLARSETEEQLPDGERMERLRKRELIDRAYREGLAKIEKMFK